MFKLTIHGRIPSKKNGKRIIRHGNIPCIISSKDFCEWEKDMIKTLLPYAGKLSGQTGLCITCDFYLPDLRRCDLSNKFESIADILHHESLKIIDDDRFTILSEVHLVYRGIDRNNPRVEITIL